MNTLISLRIIGDGKRRLDELLTAALHELGNHESIRTGFLNHPNLFSTTPNEVFSKVSRARGARLIESGVFSSDKLVSDAIFGQGRTLKADLLLSHLLKALDFFPPTPSPTLPETLILFENADFLALNKPSNLPSAPLHSNETDSAVHRALIRCPNLPVLRGNPLEPGLVHRLDTGTSGVLLFAKTLEAFERVNKVWNSGKIRKEYRAVTESAGELKLGRLELLLAHDLKSKRRMRAITNPKDKSKIRGEPLRSISEIKSIRELPDSRGFEIGIQIETGIHHQIRVTLAHFGAPILGDAVYGKKSQMGRAPEERLWLHASRLSIPAISPMDQSLEIVAPLPPNWLTG